jgi:hypothetical protein
MGIRGMINKKMWGCFLFRTFSPQPLYTMLLLCRSHFFLGWGCNSVMEQLPSMCKALGLVHRKEDKELLLPPTWQAVYITAWKRGKYTNKGVLIAILLHNLNLLSI